MQPVGSVTGVVIYKGKHAQFVWILDIKGWTPLIITVSLLKVAAEACKQVGSNAYFYSFLFNICKKNIIIYGLAIKCHVKHSSSDFTLWYLYDIIVGCCITCYHHVFLILTLNFSLTSQAWTVLLVCCENFALEPYFIQYQEHKQNYDNLTRFCVNLSISFRNILSANSSISSIRYSIPTKWTLYSRVGQLGLNGLGGEEDINAAPAHYRIRERRKRWRERTTFRQRVRYTAQTYTSYYLLVFPYLDNNIIARRSTNKHKGPRTARQYKGPTEI